MSRATEGLLTESRFEAAMAEQRAYLDQRFAEERAYLDRRLNEGFAEQRVLLEKRLGEQAVAVAELKSEIYRYLWLHGSMIVLTLSSLYALVQTWLSGWF